MKLIITSIPGVGKRDKNSLQTIQLSDGEEDDVIPKVTEFQDLKK